MKNKIFKLLISIVCIFTLCSTLTACSVFEIREEYQNSNEEEETTPDNSQDNNDDEEEDNEEETIVWSNICLVDNLACPISSNNNDEYDNVQEAYEATVSSVVTILVYSGISTNPMSSGSGFIYATSSDNEYVYVMTNGHVVSASSPRLSYEIVYYNDIRVSAELIAKDEVEDVAIIKAAIEPNNDFSVATLGNSNNINVGESIYTIGSPLGLNHNNTLTSGVVSGIDVTVSTDDDKDGNYTNMYMIQVDAALSSGNSGGPLFNMKGEVIGINTLKMTNSGSNILESFNFSIRMNKAIKVVTSLLETGKYNRPYIGVSIYDIKALSLTRREQLDISPAINYGLYINSVEEDGSLYGVVENGTIITKINDVDIYGMNDFSVELLNYLKDDSIRLTVIDSNNSNLNEYTIILK